MAANQTLESQVRELKRKLEEQVQLLDLSESKRKKQDLLVQQMKEKVECPVCLDIPRSGPVPVCPNGHFVCQSCKADSCPTCRTQMGNGKSLLASTLLENIDHPCKFNNCHTALALGEIHNHEAICPHRDVFCPNHVCSKQVSLSGLVYHIQQSPQGCGTGPTILDNVNWNRRNILIDNEVTSKRTWPVRMYEGFGQVFASYLRKVEDQIFFGLIMFATETECSKFKLELMFHERDKNVEASDMNVRFQGSPLSIDIREDKKLCVFGSTMEFILNINKTRHTNPLVFSVSFKVSKKGEAVEFVLS